MRRPKNWIAAAGALSVAAAITGCGVKGRPMPPELVQPEKIVALTASADKDGIRLAWPRPELYSRGRKMKDLAGFIVMRAEPGQSFEPLVRLPVTDRERFQKVLKFEYIDTATETGRVYRYNVISVTEDETRGEPSNVVEFRRVAPAPPPNPETYIMPTPTPLP